MLNPLAQRSDVIADLVVSFGAYIAEHRLCEGLEGGIVEVAENGVRWHVAWLECADCRVHWERRRAAGT